MFYFITEKNRDLFVSLHSVEINAFCHRLLLWQLISGRLKVIQTSKPRKKTAVSNGFFQCFILSLKKTEPCLQAYTLDLRFQSSIIYMKNLKHLLTQIYDSLNLSAQKLNDPCHRWLRVIRFCHFGLSPAFRIKSSTSRVPAVPSICAGKFNWLDFKSGPFSKPIFLFPETKILLLEKR